jgi:hypothetical protein
VRPRVSTPWSAATTSDEIPAAKIVHLRDRRVETDDQG